MHTAFLSTALAAATGAGVVVVPAAALPNRIPVAAALRFAQAPAAGLTVREEEVTPS